MPAATPVKSQPDPSPVPAGPQPAPRGRLLSLDVVRGITIAFMIMVNNNGGAGSWHLMNHAEWNGLTPTDLVFPTFLFMVGVSMVFAFESRLARGATRGELALHTLWRAAVLFLLGMVVNTFGMVVSTLPRFALEYLRFYGVLQRIALCYLLVGLFYLLDRRVWTKAAALVLCLAGYWILLRWIPVPGAGMPGRDIPFMDMRENIVSWVDRLLLSGHLYLGWRDHAVRDPEGLLSTLPALGTTLLGVLTGLWLRTRRPTPVKTGGMALAAVLCLALGYLWSLWFPLNKNLWTSSYVLVAGGYALALLAAAGWAIEQRGWRRGWTWVWVVFGSNAIAAYMFSELLPGVLGAIAVHPGGGRAEPLSAYLFTRVFTHISDPGWAAFAYSAAFTAVCFIPVWVLYRKKIFLKV